MKRCSKCCTDKAATEFGKKASTSDGLQPWCKDCSNIAHAKWQKNNSEKVNAKNAKWRADNPEKAKAASASYRAANPEKVNATITKWRKANVEKCRTYVDKWQEANPESKRICRHNRRARILKNGGVLSKDLPERLFKLQRGKCACCHVSIADGSHLDHVIPLALDGPNVDWNMQLLCPTCNLQKSAKHPVDFMQSRGFLL